MGAFDHLEWTYDGAFEQLFGLGRGELEQKFSKNSNARGGCPVGGGCRSFDLTGTLLKRSKHKVVSGSRVTLPVNFALSLGLSFSPLARVKCTVMQMLYKTNFKTVFKLEQTWLKIYIFQKYANFQLIMKKRLRSL